MKIIHISLAVFSLGAPLHAAILTVDNNPGSVAQYKTFQAAYAAAQDGDTILLAESGIFRDTHSIYKRLP